MGAFNRSGDVIADLCREVGWKVDERAGEVVRLHFKDPLGLVRKVSIVPMKSNHLMSLGYSCAYTPEDEAPEGLPEHLLSRNREVVFGGWHMRVDDDGDALFGLTYTVPYSGLSGE